MMRALEYFHQFTIPLLGRFNTAAESLHTQFVPQLGESELPVKHLLVALASLQEQTVMQSGNSSELGVLSANHYQKALVLLADRAQTLDVQVVLVSCLLSIALENFRRDTQTSFMHLKSGLRVLREWKASLQSHPYNTGDASDNIEKFIEPVFAQLELTAALTGDDDKDGPNHETQLRWVRPSMPNVFSDFATAREKLYEIGYWMNILNKQESLFKAGSQRFIDVDLLFNQWENAFAMYRAAVPSPSSFDEIEHRAMKAVYDLHYQTFLCQGHPETEMVYDSYHEKFEDLIKTAEDIFNYDDDVYDINKCKTGTPYSRDPGIVPICWSTSVNCRDPTIRRRAIALLKAHHARCGDADDCSAAAIGEEIIRVEEEGLNVQSSGDIPEERRARPLMCDLTKEGKMTMTYSRYPYMEPETVTVPLRQDLSPAVLPFKLFPLGQSSRLAGYQGLFRPKFYSCRCKSYGIS
jgi:hypothetical protein